jgi:hypothetical protein
MTTTKLLASALSLCLASTMMAADTAALKLTPALFNVETAIAAQSAGTTAARSFQEPPAPAPRMSKKKLTLILVGVGAAVAGIVFASRSALQGSSGTPRTGPQAGIVLINGVPQ